jgi:tetratricopeptide (TPR) repeat protein
MGVGTDHWEELLDRAVAIEGDVPTLRGLRLWGEVARLKMGVGDPGQLDAIEQRALALVQLAPDGAFGYAALAYAAIERGDMALAITRFREAIERDPTDSDSRYWLVAAFGYAGMLKEAEAAAVELAVRDPLGPQAAVVGVTAPFFSGEIADTIPALQRALVAHPSDFGARWELAYAFTSLGALAEAQPHLDWMLGVAPDVPYVVQSDALLRVLRADRDGALALVRALDLARLDAHLTFHIAEVYAMAGEISRGLDMLELSVARGFTPIDFIARHCPFIEPLRAQARFPAILQQARTQSEAVRQMVAPA